MAEETSEGAAGSSLTMAQPGYSRASPGSSDSVEPQSGGGEITQTLVYQLHDDPFAQQFPTVYNRLICDLSGELEKEKCTFEEVKIAFQSLGSERHMIAPTIPQDVNDLTSLCSYLRNQKTCHECDVDLLCEMFKNMQQKKLIEIVTQYVTHIEPFELEKHLLNPQHNNPTEQYFIMITVHDDSSRVTTTLKEAFEIKHCISNALSILRHEFTLVGYQQGPVTLLWQFPNHLLEHTQSELKKCTVESSLHSSKYCFSLIKLRISKDSIASVVFSKPSQRYATSMPMPIQDTVVPFNTPSESRSTAVINEKQFTTMRDRGPAAEQVQQRPALPRCEHSQECRSTESYQCDSSSFFHGAVGGGSAVIVSNKSLESYEHTSHVSSYQEHHGPPSLSADMSISPLFHCPCGKCSLATYLKDGCPQSNYPFLQLSKLDEDDREDLTQQLGHETKKIIDSFLELVDSTVESLRARNVTPLQLARRALELKAYDGTSAMMQQPLMHDEEKKLKDSNSIDGSFMVLQPHMSFFNYEPLEHIIKGIQTGSDEDRRRMEDYSKKFEQYCKRRLFEVYPTAIGQSITDSKGNVRKTFVVVTFREEPLYELISLNDAKKMTKKIASLLGLKSSTLFLRRVDEGSLMLVFSVPAFVAKDIFPLKPAVAATLKSNGYTLFSVPDQDSSDEEVLNAENDFPQGLQANGKVVSANESSQEVLKIKFEKLVSSVCSYFKGNEATFEKVLSELHSIKDFFSDTDMTRLKVEKSPEEIMNILGNYWDFVNSDLLKIVINKSDNDELKKEMSEYSLALDSLPVSLLVTKDDPPSNFSLITTNLHVEVASSYNYRKFNESLQALKHERKALRVERIDVQMGIAMLSYPRKRIPIILDVIKRHPQNITVVSIDGVKIEEYDMLLKDKPHFMLESACRGDTEVVKTLLELDGSLVKECDEEGNTALMLAVRSGHFYTVKVIAEAGGNVNDQNHQKMTPLMLAVINKQAHVVYYLLFEAKADANLTNRPDGFTALKWAAQYGFSEILKYLIQAGANVNENDTRWTALMSAAWHGTAEAVSVLVNNGAIVDIQDNEGMTALMWAARKDAQAGVLKELIIAGADLNIQTKEGKTAIMLAAECGCENNVAVILETISKQTCSSDEQESAKTGTNVVDLEIRDEKGETAILKAANGGHEEIVRKLKEAGADDRRVNTVKYIKKKFKFKGKVEFGYHEICGTNIELSGETNTTLLTTAHRKEENVSDNSITYSALPLIGTSVFEIEITKAKAVKGSMSFGVMRVRKGDGLMHKVVKKVRGFPNSCIWNTGKIYNTLGSSSSSTRTLISRSYGLKDLGSLQEGSRLGLQLSLYDGSLSFFIDKRHQGFAATGVYDDKFDVYVVVEHTGGTCGTKITRAAIHEPTLQELCLKMLMSSLKHEDEVNELPLPQNLKKEIIKEAHFHGVLQ